MNEGGPDRTSENAPSSEKIDTMGIAKKFDLSVSARGRVLYQDIRENKLNEPAAFFSRQFEEHHKSAEFVTKLLEEASVNALKNLFIQNPRPTEEQVLAVVRELTKEVLASHFTSQEVENEVIAPAKDV